MLNAPNTQRNWFPVILAGLTVLLAVIFYATNRSVDLSTWIASWSEDRSASQVPVDDPVTEAEYRAAVQSVMTSYREDGNARAAYDVLILLQVPSGSQEFHLLLVIAFGKLADGGTANVADGMARLDALQRQNSWFIL
jgi:hypothetical protein